MVDLSDSNKHAFARMDLKIDFSLKVINDFPSWQFKEYNDK